MAALAHGDAACQCAADAGAFGVLASALKDYAGAPEVIRGAATALLRLTHESAVRAHQAIAVGAEEALRAPARGAGLPKSTPPSVIAKAELARRWLALHSRLINDVRANRANGASDATGAA